MKTTTTTAQTSSKDHPPSANSVSFNWNEFCDAVMELGQYFPNVIILNRYQINLCLFELFGIFVEIVFP